MEFTVEDKTSNAKRISLTQEGQEIARAFIYFIHNNLHQEPYALLEDVFVQPSHRGQGNGASIVKKAIKS